MKTIGICLMATCYILSILTTLVVLYNVAIGEYFNAIIVGIMGGAMFFIAEIFKKEWRQGRL